MRLVGYKCEKCGHKDEELFRSSERQPNKLKRPCPECGDVLVKSDRKDNCHRWNFMDRDGF